ncbi:MAG: hypothetical protein LBP52_09005, partial [Burkholderiaceae bacterium]|nr:hypothetical protein [Burkholderiaceae bacterium]
TREGGLPRSIARNGRWRGQRRRIPAGWHALNSPAIFLSFARAHAARWKADRPFGGEWREAPDEGYLCH